MIVDTPSTQNARVPAAPALHYRENRRVKHMAKRILDLTLVILASPIIVPLVAIVWCLVILDGGPGFFGHRRLGRGGDMFRCWKLRTMVVDADQVLARALAHSPDLAAEWAANFKLEDDPRITRIGHFLRKSSLDELPQFWNVFIGEMSLVGPRPITEMELARYGDQDGCYLSQRPGITGLWQISGRNGVSYEARVAMDCDYAKSRSVWLDMKIIALTPVEMLRGSGK